MATFIGTNADETIAPYFVSPDVSAMGGARPSDAVDTIDGGGGNDIIDSGGGDDTVTGRSGNDFVKLGGGNDVFVWNPGDGSDIVDGQGGTDTLQFNGSGAPEQIELMAQGTHVNLTRDVGAVALDLHSIEQIDLTLRGGADHVTVDDMSGTGVRSVAIDLAAAPGSAMSDGQADTVTLQGRAGNNSVKLALSSGAISVTGLPEQVTISNVDSGLDSLMIQTFGGNDRIDASALTVPAIGLTINAGDGNNTVTGSGGDDTLITSSGNDVVTGGRGNDLAFLGDGDDRFIWNPGDGSDSVLGGDGTDTLQFNGSNAPENITISANASGGATLFRDVGAVTMSLSNMEIIQVATMGGADTVTVNDMTGSGVTQVMVDLAASGTTQGDGQADQVVVNGTNGNDFITVDYEHGAVVVQGLAAAVSVRHADANGDTLVINGLNGDDVIDASALKAGHVKLAINGGNGDDTIIGSQGDDTIDGGTGSDVVEGGTGMDTLQFNGSNAPEKITIGANAGHVTLFRDMANITMQLTGIEHIALSTVGGADMVTVNDLSGTDVSALDIDLSEPPGSGAGDQQPDTVLLAGTAGNDHVTVSAAQGLVTVSGLAEKVTITGMEPGTDQLQVDAGSGNDVVDLTKMPTGFSGLSFLGGAGDDTFKFAAGATGSMASILDFQAHGASMHGDVISLAGFADQTFAQAVADGHIAQSSLGVVISDGSNDFALVRCVTLDTLGAHDFRFS